MKISRGEKTVCFRVKENGPGAIFMVFNIYPKPQPVYRPKLTAESLPTSPHHFMQTGSVEQFGDKA